MGGAHQGGRRTAAGARRFSAAAALGRRVVRRDRRDDLRGRETVEQASAKEKLDTLADLASFPHCPEELGAALPLPDWVDWLDNEGLEAVRNEGEVLSRTKKPSGGDRGATGLFKQVLHEWGCEKLGRDLLPKHGSEGPFGPETQEAVKQLQLWSWLPVDGVVGPKTLAALDKHMGVPGVARPGQRRGSKEQGKSNWSVFRSPAAHIYFSTDEASLDADDERILEAMADHIASPARGAKDITLEVVGYADKRDDALYNTFLSNARAETVRDSLVELLKESVNVHFTTEPERANGKGEIERPQVGETEEELKPFRRVDVYVVKRCSASPRPSPAAWSPRRSGRHGCATCRASAASGPERSTSRWRIPTARGPAG